MKILCYLFWKYAGNTSINAGNTSINAGNTPINAGNTKIMEN